MLGRRRRPDRDADRPATCVIDFDKPALRVTYRLQELGEPTLADLLAERGLTTGNTAPAVA